MPNLHGWETSLWWVQESVKGATQAFAAFKPLAHHANYRFNPTPSNKDQAKSGSRDNVNYRKGIPKPVCTIQLNPSALNGKLWLKTFIDSDNTFSLVAMRQGSPNTIYERHVGCYIRRLTASGQLSEDEDKVTWTAEIWSLDTLYTESDTPTYTYTTGAGNDDDVLTWQDVTLKINGASVTQYQDWSWTFEQQLFRQPVSDGTLNDIVRGRRTCKGQITRYSTGAEQTDIDKGDNATAVNVEINFGADRYLFNSSAYDDVPIERPFDGMVKKMLQWKHGTFQVI